MVLRIAVVEDADGVKHSFLFTSVEAALSFSEWVDRQEKSITLLVYSIPEDVKTFQYDIETEG